MFKIIFNCCYSPTKNVLIYAILSFVKGVDELSYHEHKIFYVEIHENQYNNLLVLQSR